LPTLVNPLHIGKLYTISTVLVFMVLNLYTVKPYSFYPASPDGKKQDPSSHISIAAETQAIKGDRAIKAIAAEKKSRALLTCLYTKVPPSFENR
jgi:hypothetical protein